MVWGVDRLALGTNLVFPPVLMFCVGLLIRIPGQKNTERLQLGVKELLSDEPLPLREIRVRSKKGMRQFWFTAAYAFTFLLSFGLTISLLQALHFTWLSISIFLFFLCIVSFFRFSFASRCERIVRCGRKAGDILHVRGFLFASDSSRRQMAFTQHKSN